MYQGLNNEVGLEAASVSAELPKLKRVDYSQNYFDSTQETLRVLYAKRDGEKETTESINDIIYRVATSVAIAELKYALSLQELIDLELKDALVHPKVISWIEIFADHIGNQKFWANTPANINADPAVALKVLQYWAHGQLAGFSEEEIWLKSEQLASFEASVNSFPAAQHWMAMGKLSKELKGKGCLAACGVAFVEDSLESIQEAARMETMATKAAMGMGLNTSKIRPWNTTVANGAAASGPDRFYEKSISKAVEAVAQGGRRGGALIELRNSNHPDILIFIDKKKLTPPPMMADIYSKIESQTARGDMSSREYKRVVLSKAEKAYGEAYAKYLEKQSYLKNTNVTVIAMPGFMEAVEAKQWYQMEFDGQPWTGPIYDPRRPTGVTHSLTKEQLLEEYSVDLDKYPDAPECPGAGYAYAPEVFDRIIEGMRDSGEPGIMFWRTVNEANANDHAYDLDTCNPCGEQCLPAGRGKDGRTYMGNCNLSSLHAAHKDFWNSDGSYNYTAMKVATEIQQRFMDNVTDVSWYPIVLQNMTARMERRNGGGFAGIAEYLSRLGVGFGTAEGLAATRDLFAHYTAASVEASRKLAGERGVYPLWKGSQFEKKKLAVRNSCMVNNAPTGTLAQAMQTSWGIDPHNGVVFSRKVRTRFVDFVAPGFEDAMRKHGAWPDTEAGIANLIKAIRDNHKSVQGLAEVPEAVQKAFLIRVEISPDGYIRHLAAIHEGVQGCKYSFNSVSNTCSIPLGFPMEEVRASVVLAWKLGVKDLTFYPDGSRLSQPVEKISKQDYNRSSDLVSLLETETRKISIDETAGVSYKVKVGAPEGTATLHVSLNHEIANPGELIEIYARLGKQGAVESCLFEAVGRISSAFLQHAARFGPEHRQEAEDMLVKQLQDMQSGYVSWHKFTGDTKPAVINSPCDGLAKIIKQYRKNFGAAPTPVVFGSMDMTPPPVLEQAKVGLKCPKCSSSEFTRIEGCSNCSSCGYSKC